MRLVRAAASAGRGDGSWDDPALLGMAAGTEPPSDVAAVAGEGSLLEQLAERAAATATQVLVTVGKVAPTRRGGKRAVVSSRWDYRNV